MIPKAHATKKGDGSITVKLTGEYNRVDGWSECRENLGLNPAGPTPVKGVELVNEEPTFHDPGDEYPSGYSEVTLRFEDEDALSRASDRLFDKATEMFEYGIGRDAEKVQDVAVAIPRSVQ